MDLGRIISRSFEITVKNRALWLFGILLALFGGNAGNIGNSANLRGGPSRNQGLPDGTLPQVPQLPQISTNMVVVIVGIVVCVVLILSLLSIILRFASRGALIGLVQELEANQTRPTVRHGFDIGFDRFWSLLGIALWINIPLFLVSLLLILVAAIPLIASLIPLIQAGRSPQQFAGAAMAGIASSIALLCCVVIFLWIVQLVIQPFYQFFMRASVIGRRGARDSIREGYRLVRANLGNVIFLYVIMIGFAIVFGIVMLVLFFAIFAVVAGIAIAAGLAAQSITPGIVVGLVLGIPALLLALFVGGLYQVFDSTMWTEGYLALSSPPERALSPAPAPAPPTTPLETPPAPA